MKHHCDEMITRQQQNYVFTPHHFRRGGFLRRSPGGWHMFWQGFATGALVMMTPSLLTVAWLLLDARKLAHARQFDEPSTENVVNLAARRKRSGGR